MSKKRFGGINSGSVPATLDEPTRSIIRGICGCVVGAELAYQDQADDDHAVMMDRIRELCGELMSRVEDSSNADSVTKVTQTP